KGIRRVEVIAGSVGARANRVVKDSESRADRRLMIAERIPGNSNPWIEILERRVGSENVGHALERSKRRMNYRVERVHVGGGVGHEFVAESGAHRQPGKRLPFV